MRVLASLDGDSVFTFIVADSVVICFKVIANVDSSEGDSVLAFLVGDSVVLTECGSVEATLLLGSVGDDLIVDSVECNVGLVLPLGSCVFTAAEVLMSDGDSVLGLLLTLSEGNWVESLSGKDVPVATGEDFSIVEGISDDIFADVIDVNLEVTCFV